VKNTVVVRVGRLVEVRVVAGYRTTADVDQVFNAIADEVAKLRSPTRVVVVADWRWCPPMSDEAARQALIRLTRTDPRTERSGALASLNSPLAGMQFLRLVKESNHPNRKLFYDRDALVQWLGEVLSPPELARLREFTLESPRASAFGARRARLAE
jgi:hypothetical protein